MVPPLPPESMKEILEYLNDDMSALYSCVFVNKQWAQVALEILWRDISKFSEQYIFSYSAPKIISTLLSCLPKESKNILRNRGLKIPISTKQPFFNYSGSCRYLDISLINKMIDLMRLEYRDKDILLPYFNNSEICLSNLSELHCNTTLLPGTFYQLASICKSLEKIIIEDCSSDNEGLATLIEIQNNLKSLKIITKGISFGKGKFLGVGRFNKNDLSCRYSKIATAISSQSKSLIHFHVGGKLLKAIPPENISSLLNLQSLTITFHDDIENILKLSIFPKLKELKLKLIPQLESVIQFISRTEGYLETIYFEIPCVYPFTQIPLFNQTVAKYCPNLKYLNTWFFNLDVKEFKQLFIACPNLETLSVASYKYDEETYEAHINEFLEILEELEIDLKLKSNLCKIEFYYSWGIDVDVLEAFLWKRKERNQELDKSLQQPLLSFYFHSSFIFRSDVDFADYLELKFNQFKREGLVKDFGIMKYDGFK
ncbi:6285_t:CDS:2 [Diversispora eburnea]|uniref:6285_t:CDS:1 n=1 Tax=Diversispora eburnea TaxID=1213867 RepID=A0A9N8V031_9GLOM|nr:6285_t:CDS:2 [Diversispora eburnea]